MRFILQLHRKMRLLNLLQLLGYVPKSSRVEPETSRLIFDLGCFTTSNFGIALHLAVESEANNCVSGSSTKLLVSR